MVFSSLTFLFGFLPIFFLIYFAIPYKLKNLWALAGSLFFYAWGGPVFVFVLLVSITADYFISAKLDGPQKKQWLTLGLVLNVGLLLYFKYANFFVDNFNVLLEGLGMTGVHWTKIALPIGISFFTFQKISYLIDVYRKEKEPVKKWTDYALFVVLFPQLIAGPIVRYKEIIDEIEDRKANLNDNVRLLGLFRFSVGLAKKVLIANVLGEIADHYYGGVNFPSSTEAWLAIAAYTFQIYFDFSGYSDMAIGLGRMMGFTFPENFNFPYLSNSITDFWRRWHITLSSWMRDYLYIPLGGNRKGVGRTYFNLWAVFLISGFWHGASWNYVIWGAYHGLWLVLERRWLMKIYNRTPHFIRVAFTFFLAMLGWTVFRNEDLVVFNRYIVAMFRFDWSSVTLLPETLLAFGLAMVFSFWRVGPKLHAWEAKVYVTNSPSKSVVISVVSLVFLTLSSAYIVSSDFNPFIYFRF